MTIESQIMSRLSVQGTGGGSSLNPHSLRSRIQNQDESAALMEASREFEAIFIKQMLDSMRNTVEKSGFLDGGMAEDIFEDMLYDEYAQSMSRNGNLGLAEMIHRQLAGKVSG